jgi:hypothetical protein
MDLSKLSDADLMALQSGDLSKVSDQGLSVLNGMQKPAQAQPKQMSWSEVPLQAAKNLPSSLGGVAKGIYETVAHPLDTARNIVDIGAGALQNVLPERLVQAVGEEPISRQKAGAVGQFYKQRYGSEEGLKQALATDPAGVAADVSTVLTGGGALASKVPGLAKVGGAITKAGQAVDPLVAALRTGGKAVDLGSSLAKKGLGMTTGVGEEAIGQAYKAGQTGGSRGATFLENLRGDANMTDVLDTAKANLQEMGRQKQSEYRANMANIKADKSILDLSGIDEAANKASQIGTYKGQVTNPKAAEALQEARAAIDEWKALDPAEFHTPEGLDALKQRIGGVLESIPFEQKQARTAVGDVYNAIKGEIVKQAPEYSKAMKQYSDASEQIKEIESALSLRNKSAADTSMRKLQSLMRNNANTNYGYRTNLAQQLEQAGGREMMPALAGQALNQWTPRGLQRAAAGPGALLAYGAGGAPLAAAELAASSPRLAGEAAYKSGQLAKSLRSAAGAAQKPFDLTGTNPQVLANILYQLNQPKGQQ